MKVSYEKKGEDPVRLDVGNRVTLSVRGRDVTLVENTNGTLTLLVGAGSPEIVVKTKRQ